MRRLLTCLLISLIAFGTATFYYRSFTPQELTFSDGAHYAVVARELFNHHRWTTLFSFFGPSAFWHLSMGESLKATVLPLTPLSIYVSFLLFGVSDFSAVLPSIFFFSLSAAFIFLLARRHLKMLPSLLTGLIFILSVPFLDYATSAATEPLFVFLLILSLFLLTSSHKLLKIIGWLPVGLTFFARPHAIFYLPGFVLVFLARFSSAVRKQMIIYSAIAVAVAIPLYILFGQSLPFARYLAFNQSQVLLANSPVMPANTSLRAEHRVLDVATLNSLKVIAVKIFYDSYNLIKLLPQIYPPYLIPLVVLAFFVPVIPITFRLFFGSSFVINLLVVSASVPSFRYLHPLLPFAILLGAWTLAEMIHKFKWGNIQFVVVSTVLFLLIPPMSLFLDSRYIANTHHVGKPSAIKILGQKLGELTPEGSVIVTNLDVWGSWYGDRTTIWFPLVPDQIESAVKDLSYNPADYIYITSYRASDENLLVGEQWQSLLNDKPTITNDYLKRTYQIDQVVTIRADENYDNLPLKAVLLKKI